MAENLKMRVARLEQQVYHLLNRDDVSGERRRPLCHLMVEVERAAWCGQRGEELIYAKLVEGVTCRDCMLAARDYWGGRLMTASR